MAILQEQPEALLDPHRVRPLRDGGQIVSWVLGTTTEPEGVITLCGASNFTVERQKDEWRCGVDTPIPPRACD